MIFIQPYLWLNTSVTNAAYSLSSFAAELQFSHATVLIGPEGLYLRSYFQSLSLPYILQPVCGHHRFGDLTCSVAMVSFTCTVSCGPLAISSWARLLEKLPTGRGHNYKSTWPLKKFHFDVMLLKETNGFKSWIVVANHILWSLHLWQAELPTRYFIVWSTWTKRPVLKCNIPQWHFHYHSRLYFTTGVWAELQNEVPLKSLPGAKCSPSKTSLRVTKKTLPWWRAAVPELTGCRTGPFMKRFMCRTLSARFPELQKWNGWCIIVILEGKSSRLSNGFQNRVNKPIQSVVEMSL